MLIYKYTARDPKNGQKVQAEVQADSEQAAAKLIRQEGYAPIDIKVKGSGAFGIFDKIGGRIKTKDKVIFSRQLSTLINAGLPLIQGLRNVAGQTTNKSFKEVIDKVIGDVEGGATLSGALAKHPDVFNEVYINLVAAGETSGTLDAVLERLANQQEKDAEILSKVRGAMVYPFIVLLVMVGVVGFMVVKVLPQVEEIYKGLPNVNLPLITRIMLSFSHFTVKYWWVFALLFIIAGIFTSRWLRTIGGKRVVDKVKMRTWPFGPLFMKMYMARFARTGMTLVASGVPLIKTLEITGKSVNNVYIAESLTKAAEKVKGGKALSDSIENDPNFLPLVSNMLRIGEQSGAMEKMLEKTADYYEREVDNQIKTISTILEPVMMIILGVVAFIVVAAVLLPIYSLVGKDVIR